MNNPACVVKGRIYPASQPKSNKRGMGNCQAGIIQIKQ